MSHRKCCVKIINIFTLMSLTILLTLVSSLLCSTVDQKIADWLKRPTKDGNLLEIIDYYQQNSDSFDEASHFPKLVTLLYKESVDRTTVLPYISSLLEISLKKKPMKPGHYFKDVSEIFAWMNWLGEQEATPSYTQAIKAILKGLDDLGIWRDANGKVILLLKDLFRWYLTRRERAAVEIYPLALIRLYDQNAADPYLRNLLKNCYFTIEMEKEPNLKITYHPEKGGFVEYLIANPRNVDSKIPSADADKGVQDDDPIRKSPLVNKSTKLKNSTIPSSKVPKVPDIQNGRKLASSENSPNINGASASETVNKDDNDTKTGKPKKSFGQIARSPLVIGGISLSLLAIGGIIFWYLTM
jgi:hypothetical protein